MSGTFITTGNLERQFPSLAEFLARNRSRLPHPVTVQTLANDVADVARSQNCVVARLLDDARYHELVRDSEIVVGHCGVGFLQDCLVHGRIGNFMPRSAIRGEHIDNHQHELAAFIKHHGFGLVIGAATSANTLSSCRRDPCGIGLDFYQYLPSAGDFLIITSVGGHRTQSRITGEQLEKKGCRLLCTVVDEPIWTPDERHQIVTSCAQKIGVIPATIRVATIIRRYRPDFVFTHGAGVGLAGVLAARVLGVPVYVCESLTRISGSSRWFKAAALAGARCYIPEHATFLGRFPFSNAQAVKIALISVTDVQR